MAALREPQVYHGASLKRIDRFEHLQQSVALFNVELQYIADTMSKRRTDFQSDVQAAYELKSIDLYRITDNSRVDKYENQYKIAYNTFLNKIPYLIGPSKEELAKNQGILTGNPFNVSSKERLRDLD